MGSRDVQLPPSNFTTSTEIAPNPHQAPSSSAQADTSGANSSMNSSFPSPGSAIKAGSESGKHYVSKRIFKVSLLEIIEDLSINFV